MANITLDLSDPATKELVDGWEDGKTYDLSLKFTLVNKETGEGTYTDVAEEEMDMEEDMGEAPSEEPMPTDAKAGPGKKMPMAVIVAVGKMNKSKK